MGGAPPAAGSAGAAPFEAQPASSSIAAQAAEQAIDGKERNRVIGRQTDKLYRLASSRQVRQPCGAVAPLPDKWVATIISNFDIVRLEPEGRIERNYPRVDCTMIHFSRIMPFLARTIFGLFFAAVAVLGAEDARAQRAKNSPVAPLPDAPAAPRDNPPSAAKIALGKQLFFDPRLSGDNTMSCATCHLPDKALADGLAQAKGHGGKTLARNTPSLLNAGHYSLYTWDGRAKSLEEQALMPIVSPDEMNQDLGELEQELNAVPGYVARFQQLFGTKVTREGVAKALACFQRTLVTKPSPLDRYLAGDKEALSPAAKRGMELFLGDAGCVRCHSGPMLSDGKFYRLGISLQDEGLAAISKQPDDRGKFRTPTLRNIAQTGPYMHDGSLKTLDDVVTFYYRGAPTGKVDGLAPDIQPLLSQSFSEIPDLVAFLESLTGEEPKVIPPELP
jgi:cytochrome c peroxidase